MHYSILEITQLQAIADISRTHIKKIILETLVVTESSTSLPHYLIYGI